MPNRLDEYSRRRDFARTDEPTADVAPPDAEGASRFVVQRHAASTLHFDLRLEMDGTLRSWAIPKGLPLRSGTRRIAIRTEDHPLAYLDYEGTIPPGQYGAGRMSIWDRGTYEAILISDDDVKVRLLGDVVRAEYHLVHTDDDNWLVFRSGQWGRRSEDPADRFAALRPMLASVEPEAFDDPDWSFEIKWDGWRATCLVTAETVDLRSRSGQALMPRFPRLQGLREDIDAQEVVLDGEICVLDESGAADFSALQAGRGDVTYVVFDLLFVDGRWIMDESYRERRERLRAVLRAASSGAVLLSDDVDEHGRSLFREIAGRGGEGIVAKRRFSAYVPGTRSREWRKITSRAEVEAIICGFVPGQGARRSTFGALALAEEHGDTLRYIGRVGSGFSDQALSDLRARLDSLVVGDCPLDEVPSDEPGVVWVQPTLRCRVRHKERTSEGRLRAPVFAGLTSHEPPGHRRSVLDLSASECRVGDGEREIRLTNLHKLFWPREGLRKGDLLDYYARCAEVLVPHLRARPMVLKRYPDGSEAAHFFQHALPEGAPGWLGRVEIAGEDAVTYAVVDDPLSLLWIVNLGCIDLNPWHSRVGTLDRADWVLFDLDPQDGVPFSAIAQLSLHLRDLLDAIGLRSYAKTSGSRGIHVMVPIVPTPHDAVRLFAQVVSTRLVAEHPRLATMETHKARRGRRIYLDARQNGSGKTIASVYSVRPVPGGRVSTPVTWDEMSTGVDPSQFTMSTVPERIDRMGDLFAPLLGGDQDLAGAVGAL